jgi:hypothetical protein
MPLMPALVRRPRISRLLIAWFAVIPVARLAGQSGASQPPVITSFSINGGADTVSATDPMVILVHAIVGTPPTEYRVAHRADFARAQWLPYAPTLQLRDWYDAAGESCDAARPSHRITLYLQVRSTVGEELRIVDGQRRLIPAHVESNVLRATICARVPGRGGDS